MVGVKERGREKNELGKLQSKAKQHLESRGPF